MMKFINAILLLLLSFNAFSQQSIKRLNIEELKLPTETSARALYLNGSNQVKSHANVSDTELGYLDNVSSNIQDQIDQGGDDLANHINDTSTHGVTGDIVGTSDSQTLTNKTINADSNTISNIENADIKAGAAIDAAKLGDGSVSTTEYQYINTLSSNAQTQINAKANDADVVHDTGNETVAGEKTFTGKTEADSTTNGFRPCPVMSDAQMLAVSSPENGDCVYNSTKKGQYVYSTADSKWKPNGGGAGGSRLQLLVDGSFEDGVAADGACTTCTATQESTVVMVTPNNEKSLKMAFSASTGDYTVDKTTSAQFDGSESVVACWIKNSNAGISFNSRRNGSDTTNTTAVLADNLWHYYEIPEVAGATSLGYKIVAASSITGDIYVDECYVGPAKVIGESAIGTRWASYTPVFAGLGTVSNISVYWKQFLDTIYVVGTINPGTSTAVPASMTLPNSYSLATTRIPLSNTTANPGVDYGEYSIDGTSSGVGNMVTATGTSSTVIYFARFHSSAGLSLDVANGSTIITTTDLVSFNFSVPINGLDSSINTYTQRCQSDVGCENEFSARVSSADAVTGENLDFINGNCTNGTTGRSTCTFVTNIFTVAPNCDAIHETTGFSNHVCVVDTSSTTAEVYCQNANTNTAANQPFTLKCQKTGVDYKAQREIVGTFREMMKAPGVSKPKTCYYAFGGTGSLTAPTECTSGACTEYYDSCGTGTPPNWNTVATYTDMTFASGTWANDSFVWCDITVFDSTNGTSRQGNMYFATGDQTLASNSLGGYVTNLISLDNDGSNQATTFVALKCEGQAP